MNFVVPLCIGFTSLKVAEPIRRDSYSYPPHSQELWCSFDRPQKNERLSRPWSHLMVFNLRPLAAKNAGISWCGNFVETHGFPSISDDSPETLRKLCAFTNISHHKITWNYSNLWIGWVGNSQNKYFLEKSNNKNTMKTSQLKFHHTCLFMTIIAAVPRPVWARIRSSKSIMTSSHTLK